MAKRKKIWVQHVAVDADVLRSRLNVVTCRPDELTPEQRVAAVGVSQFLDRAAAAADRQDPVPSRLFNWFQGVLVETAYRNLHAARAQLVDLYSEPDIDAEMPSAVGRAHATLNRDDPRCISLGQLRAMPLDRRRAWLRRLVEDGYEGVDAKHAQLRSFRNTTLYAAALTIVLVALTVIVVSRNPTVMPLCFPVPDSPVTGNAGVLKNCPTGSHVPRPTGGDIWVVALLGLLGGALAATVAIRKLQGSSTPYDVPVALAWLKVPLGAFMAILGLVAIQGGFIPGLTALDTQEQILAWALLLGFAQQLFTGVLDQRAQTLLGEIPSKDGLVERQVSVSWPSDSQEAAPTSDGSTAAGQALQSDQPSTAPEKRRQPPAEGPDEADEQPRSPEP